MKKMILFIALLVSSNLFAQENPTIKEVIDNNLFKLSNNLTISVADLYVPSIHDSSSEMSPIAKKLFRYNIASLKDKKVRIEVVGKDKDSISLVRLYRIVGIGESMYMDDLVYCGYGAYTGDPNSREFSIIVKAQKKARKDKTGIWEFLPWNFLLTHNKPRTKQDILDDPCNDKVLLALMKKDSLTIDEMKIYAQLKSDCRKSKENEVLRLDQPVTVVKDHPYTWMLPLGLIAGGLSYHFFSKASDESDAIDILNKMKLKSPSLEDDRDNHQLYGIGLAVIGAVFTITSLQSVNVEVTPTGYAFNYKFYLK